MKIPAKETILYRLRYTNPLQFRFLYWGFLSYVCLELANYIPHAFVWSFKDYTFYKNIYDLPVFDEVEWMLSQPDFARYANSYAEYMVWGIFSYVVICIVSLIGLFNMLFVGPPPRFMSLSFKCMIMFAFFLILVGYFNIASTDHFDGKAVFAGWHVSIPTFAISYLRICLFAVAMLAATPAFVRKTKQATSQIQNKHNNGGHD